MDPRSPELAHRATVFGLTLNIEATCPGVNVCWLASFGVMVGVTCAAASVMVTMLTLRCVVIAVIGTGSSRMQVLPARGDFYKEYTSDPWLLEQSGTSKETVKIGRSVLFRVGYARNAGIVDRHEAGRRWCRPRCRGRLPDMGEHVDWAP